MLRAPRIGEAPDEDGLKYIKREGRPIIEAAKIPSIALAERIIQPYPA